MRGPAFVLSAVATLAVLLYVSRVESLIELRSNLRPMSGTGSQVSAVLEEEVVNVHREIQKERRLVVVNDAEGLRAALMQDRLNLAAAWDILLECRENVHISSPLIIPKASDIRISSPYWSNSPMIVGRDKTRIFEMEPGSALELSNVALSAGFAKDGDGKNGHGAGIYNDGGKLLLSNCNLYNHTAHGRGGAIFSRNGEVKLENTTFSGCLAGEAGGGIFVTSNLNRHHDRRKLVSFSRVTFESNESPNGDDFILGEDGADFFHIMLSSNWFHLLLAAGIGAFCALATTKGFGLICYGFKESLMQPRFFFKSPSWEGLPILNCCRSVCDSQSESHIEMSSMDKCLSDIDVEVAVGAARSMIESPLTSATDSSATLTTVSPLSSSSPLTVDQEPMKPALGPEHMIDLQDIFQMTLVARGAHSSVYRGVVRTNGRFGLLPDMCAATTKGESGYDRSHELMNRGDGKRVVAVKRLSVTAKSVKDTKTLVEKWREECSIMAGLVPHVNVLNMLAVIADSDTVSTYGPSSDSPFGLGLVLEWLPGSLKEALDAGLLPPRPPRTTVKEALLSASVPSTSPLTLLSSRIALDIVNGLQHLHSNHVVHRDLKATNIMLDHAGRAKISDFGAAVNTKTNSKYFTENQLVEHKPAPVPAPRKCGLETECRFLKFKKHSKVAKLKTEGTLLYAAPELLNHDLLWSTKTSVDMWSLGMVVVELYAGEPLIHIWRKNSSRRQIDQEKFTVDTLSKGTKTPLTSAGRIPTLEQASGWKPDLRELGLARESLGGLVSQSWASSPRERPTASEFLVQLEGLTQHPHSQKKLEKKRSSKTSCISSIDDTKFKQLQARARSNSDASFQKDRCTSRDEFPSRSVSHRSEGSNSDSSTEEAEFEPTIFNSVITAQPGRLDDPPYAHGGALCPNQPATNESSSLSSLSSSSSDASPPQSSCSSVEDAVQTDELVKDMSSSHQTKFNSAWGAWFSPHQQTETRRASLFNQFAASEPEYSAVSDIEPLLF